MNMKWAWLILSLFSPLSALETRPWFKQMAAPDVNFGYRLRTYQSVATLPSNEPSYKGETLHSWWIGSSMTCWFGWAVEGGATLSKENAKGTFFDEAFLALRYQLADEFDGAPLTLTAGGALTFASHSAVVLPATQHLAEGEGKFWLAAGHQCLLPSWQGGHWQGWGLLGIRFSYRGVPHLLGGGYLSHYSPSGAQIEVGVGGRLGIGGTPLPPFSSYHGMAGIKDRITFFSVALRFPLPSYATLTLCYEGWPWVENAPKWLHTVHIELSTPFSF